MQKSVCLCLFLFISFTVSSLLYAEPRHALLIANGEYKHFAGLGNPVPDANMLKDSLIQLGFEVRIIENASKEIMDSEIKMFEKKLSVEKGIGFFHYGGHAVQVKGENYLIPADADIPNEERVSTRAINLSDVMYSMKATTNIIVLDACRDNPLPSSDNRSATRGLQMVKVKPHNSVIVYSARDGETARDGVFTPILSEKILQNKNFLDVMRDVRNEVLKKTDNEQKPGLYDELLTEINLAAVSMEQLKKMTEKEEAASEELDKEIAKLRSQNKTSETEIELQKIEAEAKRKKLELQQRRDAEIRKEAEEKRIAEEKAKQNENQRLQEEKFAKMKSENDKKARELEKLRNDSLDIEGWVKSANQIKLTIDNIVNSYEIAMNKAIEETKTFYQDKREAIYITEWETTQEFENRKQSEMLSIDSTEKAD
ncbi:MAG: caspase family protein, partial [Spirochaetales bacterium]|nr:caspase family protein [Spirochaetales bacterium]